MYTPDDLRHACRQQRRQIALLLALLLPLLAAYVLALIHGSRSLMLILAILAFAWCLFAGDLLVLPARRYVRFLKEMGEGLRRKCICTPDCLSEKTELQDGVRVHALQVKLADGDSRIYYINASKIEFLPEMGKTVLLTSWGRHIVEFGEADA